MDVMSENSLCPAVNNTLFYYSWDKETHCLNTHHVPNHLIVVFIKLNNNQYLITYYYYQ